MKPPPDIEFPIYQPSVGSLERKYLLEAFDEGWISGSGRFIQEFEADFANYVGRKHAVSVFNGTVALHLALHAVGVGPGSAVHTATYTYVACANAALYVGATPVFHDLTPNNLQMVTNIDAAPGLGSQDAYIYPHLFGYATDLAEFTANSKRQGLVVIEDCSEMLGATLGDRKAGRWGEIATYSFFGNKTITTGEGGMLATDDDDLAQRLRKLRNQAATKAVGYEFDELGFNFRMTNLQAAIGKAQLERIDQILSRKREIFENYASKLNLPKESLLGNPPDGQSSQWLVTAILPNEYSREEFLSSVRYQGVDCRPGFVPMHRLPHFLQTDSNYPSADSVAGRVVLLPSYPSLSVKDQNKVIERMNVSLESSRN